MLTLVVQYQQLSVDVSVVTTVVQFNKLSVLVLVFVLEPLTQSEYALQSLYTVETQHDGVT